MADFCLEFPENPYFRKLNRKNDKMSTKFPEYKGLDLPEIADQILDFWQQNNIFEKSISEREGAEPYVFFEGPPSANGSTWYTPRNGACY